RRSHRPDPQPAEAAGAGPAPRPALGSRQRELSEAPARADSSERRRLCLVVALKNLLLNRRRGSGPETEAETKNSPYGFFLEKCHRETGWCHRETGWCHRETLGRAAELSRRWPRSP